MARRQNDPSYLQIQASGWIDIYLAVYGDLRLCIYPERLSTRGDFINICVNGDALVCAFIGR